MTPEEQARLLAEWLDGHPGREPPPELDPEVVEAVYAVRPDLAPPPRVTADDILAELTAGPLATESSAGGGGGHEAPVVPFPGPARAPAAPRRRRAPWAWGAGAGTLVALAAATLLFVRALNTSPGEAVRVTSAPGPVAQTTPSTATTSALKKDETSVAGDDRTRLQAAEPGSDLKLRNPVASEPAVAQAPDTGAPPPAPRPAAHHVPRPAPEPSPPPTEGPGLIRGGTLGGGAAADGYEGQQVASGEASGQLGVLSSPDGDKRTNGAASLDVSAPSARYEQAEVSRSAAPAPPAPRPSPPPVALPPASPAVAAAPADVPEEAPASETVEITGTVTSAEAKRQDEEQSGFQYKEIPLDQEATQDDAMGRSAAPEAARPRREHRPLFGGLGGKNKSAPDVAEGPAEPQHAAKAARAEAAPQAEPEVETAAKAPTPSIPDLGALRAEAIPPELSREALLLRAPTPGANAYAQQGQYAEAANVALGNAATPPPDGTTSAAQAAAWYLSAGQPKASLDAAQQGLVRAMGNTAETSWLWVLRGDALRAEGDPHGAAKSYEQAIELNSDRMRPPARTMDMETRPP